jgi:hypothetical protein
MRDRLALVSVMLLASVSRGFAQGPSALVIDAHTVDCVVAGRYPRFDASVVPGPQVAQVQLLFRPKGFAGWYLVAMVRAGELFSGTLPRPKRSLAAIEYYIEATDRSFGTSRTPEMQAAVVADSGGCQRNKAVAAISDTASVVLKSPSGAPPVPPGFDSLGVTAASSTGSTAAGAAAATGAGGGHGALIVIGAVGAAGAAAGLAAASKGADSSGGGSAAGATAPADIAGGIQVAPAGTLLASATLASFSTQNRDSGAHEWAFGDGSTAAGVQVTHTYASAGTFAVALTVRDSRGNAAATARTTVTAGSLSGNWTLVTGTSVSTGCYAVLTQAGSSLSGVYCASDPSETIPRGQVSDPRHVALTVYFPCTGAGQPGEANYEGDADAALGQIALRLTSRSTTCGYATLQLVRQ